MEDTIEVAEFDYNQIIKEAATRAVIGAVIGIIATEAGTFLLNRVKAKIAAKKANQTA